MKPYARCNVVGCTEQHRRLHKLPTQEDQRAKWIFFIYDGKVPKHVGKTLRVCAHHFSPECFSNYGQVDYGLASIIHLEKGAVPTIRRRTSLEDATTSVQLAGVSVACQTDPPKTRTVGTHLAQRLKPHVRSKGTQTTTTCTDAETSTVDLSSTPKKFSYKRPRLELEEDIALSSESSSHSETTGDEDSSFDPAESATASTESADETMEPSSHVHKMTTYIVYESCLLELFKLCPECRLASNVQCKILGTFLSVEQRCSHCDFFRKWNSQPILGSTPVGNLQLSAAVYTTGASFFKLQKIFRAMHLKLFQYDTFRRHARMFIEPAILHRWKTVQDGLLEQLRKQNAILGGDLRADSPGHSAKFGSYSMMDLRSNTVVDLQLVQSNEVGGSYHMEKEGLKRSLALLEARGVTIGSIVTDRHPQIQKFLREANITQFYDIWHMEKGLSKKLQKMSQNKDCEKLKKWLTSLKNHIYWTASSSTSGPERVAKWTSVLNHMCDIHTHEDPAFPKCVHPVRTSRDKSKWLEAGTPAFYKLEKLLTNKRVLKDVEKLSPHYQTSSLESFHSVILRFAPKNVVFPFLGMLCRLYLATLHFNENSGRPQATSSAGEPLYRLNFPKFKKGECTAKPVKDGPTFNYVDELLDLIFEKVFPNPAPYVAEMLQLHIPEDLSAQFVRPDKREVIGSYVSRFNQV